MQRTAPNSGSSEDRINRIRTANYLNELICSSDPLRPNFKLGNYDKDRLSHIHLMCVNLQEAKREKGASVMKHDTSH